MKNFVDNESGVTVFEEPYIELLAEASKSYVSGKLEPPLA